MPHADRSNDVVHMLYGSSGMEDPVEKRTPSLVRLTKRQKAVLKGMPQPGWYMRRDPVLLACSWEEYKQLVQAGYIVEHMNMFDKIPDVGITSRGLAAIKKKKKAP